MKKLSLVIICMIAFISACDSASSVPSEADAEKRFLKMAASPIERGALKINDFRKTNGMLQSNDKRYVLYYEADVEYLKPTQEGFQTMNPGDKTTLKNVFNYVKTDNGWKYQNPNGQMEDKY